MKISGKQESSRPHFLLECIISGSASVKAVFIRISDIFVTAIDVFQNIRGTRGSSVQKGSEKMNYIIIFI
jgi:hypothetical protein